MPNFQYIPLFIFLSALIVWFIESYFPPSLRISKISNVHFLGFCLIGLSLCFNLLISIQLQSRIEYTRQWIQNLQSVVQCTHVSIPCEKCGNTVYNVSQFGDGPSVINSRCAKCGNPHAGEEERLRKWYKENFK